MTYREFLEKQEQTEFNLPKWLERLTFAQGARGSFDTDYDASARTLSNQVSTSGKDSLDKYTNDAYHTNWLLKLCIWQESNIMSADIYIDLESSKGVNDLYADRLVLEQEVNYLRSEFRRVKQYKQIIRDRMRYGYGAAYNGWNELAIDANWRKGKPNFLSLDCRRVWVDESSVEDNFEDRRWVFALVQYDVDDAKRLYPELKNKIAETPANTTYGDAQGKKDKFDVYICQYHVKQILRMCDVEISEVAEDGLTRKDIKQYLAEEVQEWIDTNNVPDNVQILDMADPENIGYDCEVDNVFEFKFSPQISEVLSDVRFVQKNRDNFIFWTYHRIEGDIYPRGTAFMLSQEQKLKTIIMTKAVINAIKDGRAIPFVREGAIKDPKDFIDNHNSLDYVGVIPAEWTQENGDRKPFETIEQKFDPSVTLLLNNLLKEDMQEFSGGTDSMMGQAQYAGMSAAQTGMLQASGATYNKVDDLGYKEFVRDDAELDLINVGEYRTYEHYLEGQSNEGKPETLIVNEGNVVDWDYERYHCVPEVEQSSEMQKQMKENKAMQLSGMGKMSGVRLLEELGYPDASRIVQEAEEEAMRLSGQQQAIEMLQSLQQDYPETYNKVMQMMQNPEQKTKKASNA